MAWSQSILAAGCRDGAIVLHDVRERTTGNRVLQRHTQEVCGISWSPDGRLLATGGNDNLVVIWDRAGNTVHTLEAHTAAVKALAWCPWQPSVLATGGGTADKSIKFWNASRGTLVNSIDTKSQISGLLWNAEHRELISGHGFSENQLSVWKFPSLTKVTELTGHTERILSMAISPDGTTVVSAAGDETLRFWKCFLPGKKKDRGRVAAASTSRLASSIR